MDKKKKKWEKPVLESIDEPFSYGYCKAGSLYTAATCWPGGAPYNGCGSGLAAKESTPGCINGPSASWITCNTGTGFSTTPGLRAR